MLHKVVLCGVQNKERERERRVGQGRVRDVGREKRETKKEIIFFSNLDREREREQCVYLCQIGQTLLSANNIGLECQDGVAQLYTHIYTHINRRIYRRKQQKQRSEVRFNNSSTA